MPVEEFHQDNVLIPSRSSVLRISKDVVARDPGTELVPLSDIFKPETEKLFYAKDSLPNVVPSIVQNTQIVPTSLYFYKEVFVIDVILSKQRGVDLTYEPITESVQLKVDSQPSFIYNKHYAIIKNNGKLNRLTWDPRRISNGVGLVDILVEDTTIEVQYARRTNE